jgi:hypothetical protein
LHSVEELATDVWNVTHALIMWFNFAARWQPGMGDSTISTLINCCHALDAFRVVWCWQRHIADEIFMILPIDKASLIVNIIRLVNQHIFLFFNANLAFTEVFL